MSNSGLKVRVREAVEDDASVLLHLIKGLCEYEKEDPKKVMTITETELLRDGFGENKFFDSLIAEVSEGEDDSWRAVGFAVYFKAYSTWKGRALYLEDLFVQEEDRGKGIGSELLKKLCEMALSLDCARLEWCCLDWNEPALDFYKSIGAQCYSEWKLHHFTNANMKKFVEKLTTKK